MALQAWIAGIIVSAIVAFKFISFRRHPLKQFPGPLFCALSNAGLLNRKY
ncbi:hypothetical protein QBC39DRAFT_372521 [Podospora conica]|nr:hypothetical protein QBC39DRAFT_372521 [Schizothecium conicum]